MQDRGRGRADAGSWPGEQTAACIDHQSPQQLHPARLLKQACTTCNQHQLLHSRLEASGLLLLLLLDSDYPSSLGMPADACAQGQQQQHLRCQAARRQPVRAAARGVAQGAGRALRWLFKRAASLPLMQPGRQSMLAAVESCAEIELPGESAGRRMF